MKYDYKGFRVKDSDWCLLLLFEYSYYKQKIINNNQTMSNKISEAKIWELICPPKYKNSWKSYDELTRCK